MMETLREALASIGLVFALGVIVVLGIIGAVMTGSPLP